MGDDDPDKPAPPTLETMFIAFAKFGELGSSGEFILLSQLDKWMRQAKLLNKKLTLTHTGMAFSKFKRRAINYEMFLEYLENLCDAHDLNIDEVKEKMTSCGLPTTQATKAN